MVSLSYEVLRFRGVQFLSQPQEQAYGVESLFRDLYGDVFSLLEPAAGRGGS